MKKILTPIRFALSLAWIFCIQSLQGQDTILLKNPSFEDIPHRGSLGGPGIKMWNDCGSNQFPRESPPDIHPVVENGWNVSMQPQEGSTYLGLVVRENGSWESVSQQLSLPLLAGRCYSLTAMMTQSGNNKIYTPAKVKKGAHTVENISTPAILLIWGGREDCEKLEILTESSEITNHEWKPYELILSPHGDYTHITFEVFYSKSKEEHYNGHVLIDNLSPIIEVDCK